MEDKKVLFIATVGRFFNFERNDIKSLYDAGYQIYCAANFVLDSSDDYQDNHVIRHQINFSRSPFSKTNYKAYKELKRFINQEKFTMIHCHTPVGGVLGRLASRQMRAQGSCVIYTAHGFHFYDGAPLVNWLLFYPVEWICSFFTDVLITINKEDYKRACAFHSKDVRYVPGIGINTNVFCPNEYKKVGKRELLDVNPDETILFSVGELNVNKNHQVIIHALAKLQNPKLQYFIAGSGILEKQLKVLVKKLNLDKQVHFLGYRKDISELLHAMDIYLLPSIREGLNVSLMEAMACGLPVICSDIRGNKDLVENEQGGFRVKAQDINEWVKAIQNLTNNKSSWEGLGQANCHKIEKESSKIMVQKEMKSIYFK